MKNRLQSSGTVRIWIFAMVGGILFAAFDRCGYMLKRYGSIWAVSENPWHRTVFHRIALRLPVSVLAVLVLLLLTDWFLGKNGQGSAGNRRNRPQSVRKRSTGYNRQLFCLWTLYFISFLPAFLGGYPGIFAADAPNQIGWTFSGWLTAHHPLLHTGILCGIFWLSRMAGASDQIAAAAYTLLQMAALSGIFTWISRVLKKEEAPVWLQAGTVVYLCLFPFHGMMAVYTTKDTIFSGIFVLSLLQVCRMCRDPEHYFEGYRNMLGGGCCFALLFLFRNNGFHTLVLCLPFLLLYLRKYWKKVLVLFAGLLALYLIYNGPFLRLVGAEPGNPREAYSVLMQTLGRTYAAGGDIRPEEMDVIRPVMDEETLALYTPNLSDPIKNQFHAEAFEKEKARFLKAWFSVGWRNKKIYVDGFLNTTAAFWYPGTEEEYLEFTCFDIEKDNPLYPHVRMTPASSLCYRYYTAIGTDASFRNIPVVRELLSMGFYFWLMVYAGLYLLYRREYGKLLWTMPLWTYMATGFLGPAALVRYAYPVMLSAPVLCWIMAVSFRREGKTDS